MIKPSFDTIIASITIIHRTIVIIHNNFGNEILCFIIINNDFTMRSTHCPFNNTMIICISDINRRICINKYSHGMIELIDMRTLSMTACNSNAFCIPCCIRTDSILIIIKRTRRRRRKRKCCCCCFNNWYWYRVIS